MFTRLRSWITSLRQPPVTLDLTPPTHTTRWPVRPIPQPAPIPSDAPYTAIPHHGRWAITHGATVRWPGLSEGEARTLAKTLNSEARLQAKLAAVRNTGA